jgi:Tol biopolymer transport system component
MNRTLFIASLIANWAAFPLVGAGARSDAPSPGAAVQQLADEVRAQGWLCYAARSERGDWDLFVCRPDGSVVRNLTRTPAISELSPQFSRDGRKLLYRRMPPRERLDNNRHGEQGELVLANADGSAPVALGRSGELPWASFSPDGTQIASLSIKGIAFYHLERRAVVRTLPRRGFFQQVTWSPDGRWLVGVANSFGASWSIARMDVATGEASAVNRVDCCTPDWFPDSRDVIFSWRPPGQRANKGYGWTQLWRVAADGTSPQLVYGEEGRHVYGGHVSPDGKYVLFTGNVEEDGDPGRAGAPMALMRLSDGPVIVGQSRELRARHPRVNDGPVLTLPIGWEPCWTAVESLGASASFPSRPSDSSHSAGGAAPLARELHALGWLVFSARTERGDWDLFRMRPDGTDRRKFVDLPGFNEGGARFSPDGRRVLFYRLPQNDPLQNNEYGTGELVIADADGSRPVVFGNTFAWATWGPDSRQLACLAPKGIQIVDVETRQLVRQLPRKGLVSQLVWSADGRRFIGTANGLGPFWTIGCLAADTGELKAISETERYNCTPDWVAGSRRVLYSRGIIPEQPGRAELWVATLDGQPPLPLYAEESHHIYGACASPDMKYLLFTRSAADLTKVEPEDTQMAVIRWADTPMRGDDGEWLERRFPTAKTGPRLDLGPGWEPMWTTANLSVLAKAEDK